jgi:hypothetical protein
VSFHVRGARQLSSYVVALNISCDDLSIRSSRPSGGADGFPAIHLIENAAALRALDNVRCQTHQFVWLSLVSAERAGHREDEVGFSFEPRRHHPTRPSAFRTGFRIMRCESRPRNTSDGR